MCNKSSFHLILDGSDEEFKKRKKLLPDGESNPGHGGESAGS